MARTKETKMFPEQQEKMTQEVMASLHPSTYGKDYAQKHSSFFEEVENSDLEVVTENVAATTSNMEDELTNEVQSPPNLAYKPVVRYLNIIPMCVFKRLSVAVRFGEGESPVIVE